jgi:hypothetical protein
MVEMMPLKQGCIEIAAVTNKTAINPCKQQNRNKKDFPV